MKQITESIDEFFPDLLAAEVESERLTVLRRVARKEEFDNYSGLLIEALLAEQSCLEAYVRIRNVADIVEVALTQLKDRAILAMEGPNAEVLGSKVILKALPRRFEYDDPVVCQLEEEKKRLEERLKSRKKLLEGLKEEVANTATGEILKPARCVAAGSTLQITF